MNSQGGSPAHIPSNHHVGPWLVDPQFHRDRHYWCCVLTIFSLPIYQGGLPRWLSGKESTRLCRRHGFDPWVGKTPWGTIMATHSSILAWKMPWTEEPGGLQSMGSQRVGKTAKEAHTQLPATHWTPYKHYLRFPSKCKVQSPTSWQGNWGSERLQNVYALIWLPGFPDGLSDKESACDAADTGLIPGSRRSLGGGK